MFEVLVECLHDKLSFLFLIDCYSEVLSVTLISHLLIGSKSLDDLILIICLQKASHLDWLGLLAGLFSVLQIKPDQLCLRCCNIITLFSSVPFAAAFYAAVPPSQSTHPHTRSHSLTRAHTCSNSHMLIHPYLCSHSFTHTQALTLAFTLTHAHIHSYTQARNCIFSLGVTQPNPGPQDLFLFVLFVCSMLLCLSTELKLLCLVRHILFSCGGMAVCRPR